MIPVSLRYKETRVMGLRVLVVLTVISAVIDGVLYGTPPWELPISGLLAEGTNWSISFAVSFILWCAAVRHPRLHDRPIAANLLILLPLVLFLDSWIIERLRYRYDEFEFYEYGEYAPWHWGFLVTPYLRIVLMIVAGLLLLRATGQPRLGGSATWGGQLTVNDVRGRG